MFKLYVFWCVNNIIVNSCNSASGCKMNVNKIYQKYNIYKYVKLELFMRPLIQLSQKDMSVMLLQYVCLSPISKTNSRISLSLNFIPLREWTWCQELWYMHTSVSTAPFSNRASTFQKLTTMRTFPPCLMWNTQWRHIHSQIGINFSVFFLVNTTHLYTMLLKGYAWVTFRKGPGQICRIEKLSSESSSGFEGALCDSHIQIGRPAYIFRTEVGPNPSELWWTPAGCRPNARPICRISGWPNAHICKYNCL